MNALLSLFVAAVRLRPFVSACVALTVAFAATAAWFWHAHRAAQAERDAVREKGELLIRTLGNRPKIERDLADLRTAIDLIDRNLADEQSMEVNLGYFYRVEKNTRVRLLRLNQLSAPLPAPGTLFKTVPFSMQVTGSYRASLAFLHALETGPRIVRIRSCAVERGPGDADVTVELTVEILAKT